MTALDWLRSKAVLRLTDQVEIGEADADVECPAGVYKICYFQFEGVVPTRMAFELRDSKTLAALTNTALISERLQLGNGYRSGFNNVRYARSEYTRIG